MAHDTNPATRRRRVEEGVPFPDFDVAGGSTVTRVATD
jgi:hypothetical protein